MLKSRASLHRSGFTLVELIVAMAILVIIVAAMGQIMGTASNLTTANNKHTDANGRARTVFDRMATDFARMVKRSDVDFIFWKATGNDAMFFYTEGAGYYDGTTPGQPDQKNSVSLVGYRVNNLPAALSYGQMERLGKALLWDGAAGASPSMIFLNYPAPENQATGSAAYGYSTLADGTLSRPAVGTPENNFTDSTDTSYHPLASNVFRLEYSFQLMDGTRSDIPVMQESNTQTPIAAPNLVPFSLITTHPPTSLDDSKNTSGNGLFVAGSRWWDKQNQIGYICADASASNAVWHEIGIQDISAIVVTIAVIDDQGLTFLKARGGNLNDIASKLLDYDPTTRPAPDEQTAMTTGDPAYLLDPLNPSSWAYALRPGQAVSSIEGASQLPQAMISQIRIYQRFFYINNT